MLHDNVRHADSRKSKPKKHAEQERTRIEKDEDEVTLNSDESFPASDPPSWIPVKGAVNGADKIRKAQAARHYA